MTDTIINNIEQYYYNQLLYLQSKVSDDVLIRLKEEAKYILENESEFRKYNKSLAGNIEKEYEVKKTQEILRPNLIVLANEYCKHTKKRENQNYSHWDLKDVWINFQKKHEHNPLHNHSGNLSFVLWVQIPYDLKEELELSNSKNSNTPSNSLFSFVFTDIFGNIVIDSIKVDKSYEGTIIMFDANLMHVVHPFHTSDNYRISISGNLISTKSKNNTFVYK